MRRISEELNQTSYKTTLSLAPYKVSVVALNRVGTSPPQTIAIAAGQHQGPPNLNLSVVDNHTLRASWSDRSTSFYCAILELVSTETIQHNRCLSIKHQERKKNNGLPKSTGPQGTADARTMEFVGLEPLRRYRLTVYIKDLKEKKKCRGKTGSTIGSVTACTQEQPPAQGPSVVNVTSIMKSSTFITWKGISLGECEGVLQKYLIIYTDGRNHTHTASVNASTMNFTLTNLNASTLYTVKVCGVSSVGQGAGTVRTFHTDYDRSEPVAITVATSLSVMFGVFMMVSLCYLSIKRIKRMICPVVADPINSLAVKPMPISDYVSQWETCSADEDVMDALLVMVMAQHGAPSPDVPAAGCTEPVTEGSGSVGDSDSLGFGSGSTFAYRRQTGGPSAPETQCGADDCVDEQTEGQGPALEPAHLPPWDPQPCPDSGLNPCGNMISLLSVYDQTVVEQDPAGSHVHS
ncbi:uncharacterized protein LOC116989693 [Amblyraja radiata]|uniref:uncharacterized protein LOC116989693 n=1 Tax=Amblyraja radiata TaxID=386614 RepID=UPI00140215C8|nr:uncharacterized protein LOC116989693 [Amblyraja radiata]